MDKFTSKHFAFLLLGVSIVSLKTYPGIFMRNGGRDSWVAMLFASAIVFIIYMYIVGISEKNNKPNICQVYQGALGKGLGNIFICLLIITLIFTLIEASSVEANSMRENMLIETPTWYFLLFFIVPCVYVIFKDIVAIVTITIIGISLIMLAGINLAFLTSRYKHYQMLFPILTNGLTPDFFICIVKIISLYGAISIILPYLYKIEGNKKSLLRGTLGGLLIVIQMQIVSVTGLVMTFVPSRFNSLNYPKLIQTQLVSYSQFIEFGELYVMLQILGGWLLKYLITFYSILIILMNLNMKKRGINYMIIILSTFVFIAAYFSSKNLFILFKLLNYYTYICLFNFIIVPVAMYSIFNIKNKQNRDKN